MVHPVSRHLTYNIPTFFSPTDLRVAQNHIKNRAVDEIIFKIEQSTKLNVAVIAIALINFTVIPSASRSLSS